MGFSKCSLRGEFTAKQEKIKKKKQETREPSNKQPNLTYKANRKRIKKKHSNLVEGKKS